MFNVSGFLGVPPVMFLCRRGAINYVFPVIAYGMDFFVIVGVGFAFFLGLAPKHFLERIPFLFGHFEFLDVKRIPYVAVDDDVLHGGAAVGLERYAQHTRHLSFVLVVGAGATTLHAALTNCY